MTIKIIGLGLIGGSLGLVFRQKGHHVVGIDHEVDHLKQAQARGLIDGPGTMDDLSGDVIVLAVPTQHIIQLLPKILDQVTPATLVLDMGSTKQAICESVSTHPNRGRFLAVHPIAGTEFSGPGAAFDTLFKGKTMIVCEPELMDEDAWERGQALIVEVLEMSIHLMHPEDHDFHLAVLSHLSHITSFGLGQTALNFSKNTEEIVPLAGSGFASTVRLAKSSPEMWTPIFLQNKKHLLTLISDYQQQLEIMRALIDAEDADGLQAYLAKANNVKKLLD